MIVDLNELLTIILYLALIVLVIVFIVLGIRLMHTLKKIDVILDDVNNKMSKVDGVFNIIDMTTDYATSIGDKIIGTISNIISTLMGRKKGNDEDE